MMGFRAKSSPSFELPVCRAPFMCRSLLPGTRRHAVVLCTNRENIEGQHVVCNVMDKGRIPLGLFDRIWQAHLAWTQGGPILFCRTPLQDPLAVALLLWLLQKPLRET